eukprot:TRINITY_DN47003_c0_g1_i1.p1 TRINITY_DN47003_c0_g1~~TRINITY_DN47003_c0_g1_i1.p1  ORF type:complete len:480 (+),score=45.24 TRINITY_DN47003_c0_g1_i1:58-1497(+)
MTGVPLPDATLSTLYSCLDDVALLIYCSVCQQWRHVARRDEALWRQRVASRWQCRQKPSSMWKFWRQLVAAREASPLGAALTTASRMSDVAAACAEMCNQHESDAATGLPREDRLHSDSGESLSHADGGERLSARSRGAPSCTLGSHRGHVSRGLASEEIETMTWQQRYVAWRRDEARCSLEKEELCYDLALDSRRSLHGAIGPRTGNDDTYLGHFPRRWVLVDGADMDDLRYLGDEMQFLACGTVEARSCLLKLDDDYPFVQWRWRWAEEGKGSKIVLYTLRHPRRRSASESTSSDDELSEHVFAAPEYTFDVFRASDGGFMLTHWSAESVMLASREKTEEEHIYRVYGELRCPSFVRQAIDRMAQGKLPPTVVFPASLTSFERLAVHRYSEQLGMHHLSTGVGLERRITVMAVPQARRVPATVLADTGTPEEDAGSGETASTLEAESDESAEEVVLPLVLEAETWEDIHKQGTASFT